MAQASHIPAAGSNQSYSRKGPSLGSFYRNLDANSVYNRISESPAYVAYLCEN